MEPSTILSISRRQGSSVKTTPNLLPCRIHHNGAVGSSDMYWSPSNEPDGSKTAYFRGRKLRGKGLKVPEGYRGVVVEKKEAQVSETAQPDGQGVIDVDLEDEIPPGELETAAEFDGMIIWGHESVVDASSDPYVRGVDEWIKLSDQIHSYDAEKA